MRFKWKGQCYELSLKKKGIEVKHYKDIEEISDDVCPEIAIVFPPKNIIGVDADSKGEYYRILYHYIKFAQMMALLEYLILNNSNNLIGQNIKL